MRRGWIAITLLGAVACRPEPEPRPPTAAPPPTTGSADPAPVSSPRPDPGSGDPSEPPSSRARVSGPWIGSYSFADGSRPPASFTAELVLDGTELRGRMVEPNAFADPAEAELTATVVGTISAEGQVDFDKRYDGRAGVRHTVTYTGQLDAAGTHVEGHWSVRGRLGGPFVMDRQFRPRGLAMVLRH